MPENNKEQGRVGACATPNSEYDETLEGIFHFIATIKSKTSKIRIPNDTDSSVKEDGPVQMKTDVQNDLDRILSGLRALSLEIEI